MLRILHLGKFYPPFAGGMENFLADLMSVQARQGHTVAALVHEHRKVRFLSSVQAEVDQYALRIYRAPCYGRLFYVPISPHFPFWLHRVLVEFQPQILHLHLPNPSVFWGLCLSQAKKIPWVVHWHSDVVSEIHSRLSYAYRLYRPFEQRVLAHAAAIIATSPPYLASSQALRPWQEKCHVVPLGLSLERLPEPSFQARAWAGQEWDKQGLRILCIGRLTYYKGHDILIQAMSEVERGQVIIVGEGELRQRLEMLITRLNLSDKVKLIGYCDTEKLIALLATCEIFCLPSLERTEAFGVVLLEAMRYAKPIIATDIKGSGTGWVVEGAGILVPPQEVKTLVEALQQLMMNPSLRIQLGEAGQQKFIQKFDMQTTTETISEIYREIIGVEKN